MVAQSQIRMTAAEFAQLPESSGRFMLLHGELIEMPTPKDPHQTVVGLIFLLPHNWRRYMVVKYASRHWMFIWIKKMLSSQMSFGSVGRAANANWVMMGIGMVHPILL